MEEISCRMCGKTVSECKGCGWVKELENAEGGICLPCLLKFMGHPFSLTRSDGDEVFANMEEKGTFFRLNLQEGQDPTDPFVPEKPTEPKEEVLVEDEVRRKVRLVGGPLDNMLYTQQGAEPKSRAHIEGDTHGVYTFKGMIDIEGREVWEWKEYSSK